MSLPVNKGFTLIELIIVIVVLAIVAAIALPRFVDLKDRSQLAVMDGLEGAMRSGAATVYSQALVEGQNVGVGSIVSNGATIELHSGYPIGNLNRGFKFAINLDNITFTPPGVECPDEWCGRGNQSSVPGGPSTTTGLAGKIWPTGYEWGDECGVYYINHEDGTEPLIGQTVSDC
jgi:MSHA pilin protein MshA